MATPSIPRSEQDRTGLFRIATGAGLGLAAALLAPYFVFRGANRDRPSGAGAPSAN